MSSTTPRSNRGPAAAVENRDAILRAARTVFAAEGYRVPFSAIAREAGVGQAVMYRHFPSKFDLARAVFEENMTELEELATEPSPDAFWRVWDRLVEMTIGTAAFVEMFVEARQTLGEYSEGDRLRTLLSAALEQSRRAGRVDPGLSTESLLLAERMVYGVVVTTGADGAFSTEDAVAAALAQLSWMASRPR